MCAQCGEFCRGRFDRRYVVSKPRSGQTFIGKRDGSSRLVVVTTGGFRIESVRKKYQRFGWFFSDGAFEYVNDVLVQSAQDSSVYRRRSRSRDRVSVAGNWSLDFQPKAGGAPAPREVVAFCGTRIRIAASTSAPCMTEDTEKTMRDRGAFSELSTQWPHRQLYAGPTQAGAHQIQVVSKC